MSWIGMKIAGTPTIAARLLMARRGSLETVVGVVRGGSWDADLSVVRSANRRGIPTSNRNTTCGFRVARTP
jgi:formylglycine-generating enzyme required for sulfatase activity